MVHHNHNLYETKMTFCMAAGHKISVTLKLKMQVYWDLPSSV